MSNPSTEMKAKLYNAAREQLEMPEKVWDYGWFETPNASLFSLDDRGRALEFKHSVTVDGRTYRIVWDEEARIVAFQEEWRQHT